MLKCVQEGPNENTCSLFKHGISCLEMCPSLRRSHLHPKLNFTQPAFNLSGPINLSTASGPAESSWLQRSSTLPVGWRGPVEQTHYWCIGWPLTQTGRTIIKHTKLMTADCSICFCSLGLRVFVARVGTSAAHRYAPCTAERRRDWVSEDESERCVNWFWVTIWTRDFRQDSPPACNEVSSGRSNHHRGWCQASGRHRGTL